MITIADLLTIAVSLTVGLVIGAMGMYVMQRARLQRPDEQQMIYMRGYMDGLDDDDRRGAR